MDYPPKSSHGPAPPRCKVEGGSGGGGAEVDGKKRPSKTKHWADLVAYGHVVDRMKVSQY